MKTIKIAIDGPAGAGKSTISKCAASKLGFIYIDTGAMYRAVALYAINKGIDTKIDKEGVISLLPEIDIDISHVDGEQHVFLNGEDVSSKIRTPEVSLGASNVAVIPEVRIKLVELQRALSDRTNVIMDGRDIGTYVLPDADVKIFLTASVEDRARRRYEELLLKGNTRVTYDEVLEDMKYRDKNDSSREFAPLRPADDGIILDTTNNELDTSIELVISTIQKRVK